MKRTHSPFYARRTFILSLLSFVAVAALVTFGVSARRASREAALREIKNNAASAYRKGVSQPGVLALKADDKNPNVPNAAGITADLVDAFPDGDANNKVNPGDLITYTATITSNGADPATGVTYTATVDAAATLLPATINVQPIALGESYTAFGNVQISVANGATNLLANDCDPNPAGGACTNAGLTISVLGGDNSLPFAGTTAQSGQVTASASDGTFTYNPAPGFNGSDTFTYTVRDAGPDTIPGNADDLTDTATATITVGPTMIWFINNQAAPGGDGRISSPFNSIAAFNAGAADEAGDIIFIYNGTGTYTGGLTLLNTQKLIGQGFLLQTETGAPPTGSEPLPVAGSSPTIDNPNATIVTVGQNNTLRGFNTGNSGSTGTDISGTSFGTLTVSALSINGDGRALNLTTGTLAATVANISASNTGSLDGLTLNGVGGALTVSGTTSITNPGGDGIDISNGPAGHNFAFGTATISKNAAGADVTLSTNLGTTSFTSLTVSNSSGAGITTNAGGTVNVTTGSITTTGTGVAASFTNTVLGMTFTSVSSNGGANGLVFSGGSGTFTSGTTNLQNNASIGLLMSSTGVAANFGNTTVNSSAGDAVDLSSNTAAITFADLDMTPDSGLRGLDAQNNTQTITVTSGDITTLGGVTASAVFIDGPAGRTPINITFTSVTTSGVGNSIHLVDISGTKFQVTGTTQVNTRSTTNGGAGVFVDNATTTNIQLATTNIPNPSAAGGQGIHIEDSSSTVTVATATISDANVTSAQTDGNTDNIPDSDGDGDAIFLKNNTGSFTLSGGTLSNCGNDCIDGRTVTNLTINNVTINGPGQDSGGQGAGGHGISLINISGTSNMDELLVQQFGRSQTDGFRAINTDVNGTVNVTDGRFENTFAAAATAGNDGIFFEMRGTSNMTLLVDEVNNISRFKGLFGEGIQVSTGAVSSGTTNVTVTDTEFVDAFIGTTQTGSGHNGLRTHGVGSGDVVVNIQNNTFTNVAVPLFQQGVISLFTNDNASVKGQVVNNTITNATQAGIQLFCDNAAGQTITEIDVNIASNTINNTSGQGILVNIGAAGSITEANIRINSNNIGQAAGGAVGDGEVLFGFGGGPNASQEGVTVNVFGTTKTVNFKMNGNNVRSNAAGVNTTFPPANETLALNVSATSGTPFLNATVTNNQLLQLDDTTNGAAFFANVFDVSGTPQMCLDFTGNTGNTNVDFFILEQSTSGTIFIENIATYQATNTGTFSTSGTLVNSAGCTEPPAAVALKYDRNRDQQNLNGYQTPQTTLAMATALAAEVSAPAAQPVATTVDQSSKQESMTAKASQKAVQPVVASTASETTKRAKEKTFSHHAQFKRSQSMKASAADKPPLAPEAGTVGPITIGTLAPGDSVIVTYQAQVISPPTARQTSHQGTVSGSNFASVLTNDPDTVAANDATITAIDTTATWSGATNTDWNVATNWTQGFVPNSVSDVIIPDAGVTNEPNIISVNVNVFTLDLQSARTLTINSGRNLTVNGGLTTIAGALAGGPYTLNFVGLTLNRPTGITLNGSISVSGVLTLTSGVHTVAPFTLTVGSTSTIVRTAGYIIGKMDKIFSAPGAFVFHVGTANGYSPVNTTVTAGSGNLTVLAVQGPQPVLDPTKSLARYWTLTEGGAITANLVFTYNQPPDVVGTEANYRVTRVTGSTAVTFKNVAPCPGAGTPCVDPGANTATIDDVSSFSDWTVAEPVAPTAADGTVTGRIVADDGTPVEGAVVRLSGAQNRKFITDANGFYRFDNVETNGFYNVTPARVNYTFSPSVISFSQIGETTEAGFGATATGGTANPLDTPEYFVRQHYLDFLSREPDEAGFNFWSDQILGCGDDTDCVDRKRTNVSAAYFLSIEFQETGGLVDGLYRASYGVRPTFAEFKADAARVAPMLVVGREGWEETLENGKAAFVNAFVQRAAFHAAYDGMSNDAYVDTLIANTGVSFTASERDSLVSGLGSGGMTRATVLRAVAENGQFRAAKRNEAFVMMEYFGYLRREPDAGGYQFWLNKLNEFNGNFEQAEMVKSFIISGEYRERFPR